MHGYRQERHNPEAFLRGGWLNTGDLGYVDGDGYFWLTGRAKDIIIRGGHNITPACIEEALYQHPAVALAAAVGKPDAHAGEVPVAYVTLKPGSSVDAEGLRAFALERVPERPAAPAEVIILPQMPVTAVGKIFKPALRQDATKRAMQAALAPLVDERVSFEVAVVPHGRHGSLTRIVARPAIAMSVEHLRSRIDELLLRFTGHREVIIE